eukprot:CAMPEP_0118709806 /NCGR_PEP_ID=MMETSP0800-20121206/22918_1 /TAXON_ID=210618 ORGANISM="Striatella unipunctata, Strain CCMP2910" /NCGR_SAMPLE_ID=MMETSP0800 /ASSEMBLY_ACC=CAM_ASM_000638 /LENGTH=61 /DNA_ID=CAMNT_0006613693 /DNA_START=39 /DNA_END=224 /DNA_ORIENTATION=+
MNQLTKLSSSDNKNSKAEELVKKTKTDLYAIAACVDRKDVANALAAHEKATKSLVAFVTSL